MKKIFILCFMLLSAIGFGQLSTVPMGVGTKLNVAFPIINTAIDQINVNTAAIAGFTGSGLGFINVQDTPYGATGDGVTDDLTDIQSAIDACATAGGGIVYMPKGTYRISHSIVMKTKVRLEGQGKGLTIIKATDIWNIAWLAHSMITFQKDAYSMEINELTIDGNKDAYIGHAKRGIFGIYTYNYISGGASNIIGLKMKNVEVMETSGWGIAFSTCTDIDMDDIYVHECGDSSVWSGVFASTIDKFRFTNGIVDSCYEQALYLLKGKNAIVTNSRFSNNTDGGLDIRIDSNVVIANNIIEYNGGIGFDILKDPTYGARCKNVVVTGNIIRQNVGTPGAFNTQVVIYYSYGVLFANNQVEDYTTDNAHWGIILDLSNDDVVIRGNNIIARNGVYVEEDTIRNIVIENNYFAAKTAWNVRDRVGAALRLQESFSISNGLYFRNNVIDSCLNGIYIASGWKTKNTVIKNNEFRYIEDYMIYDLSTVANKNIERKGSSSFTTTSTRKAVYFYGMNSEYDVIATPISVAGTNRPSTDDLVVGFAKTDSVIFLRPAGTTSGLTFKYVINND